jgi:hypothetical protein
MTANKTNYEFKKKPQLLIEFCFIWLNNLKFVESRKSPFFHVKYSFFPHFASPWTLSPGAAAPLPCQLHPCCW